MKRVRVEIKIPVQSRKLQFGARGLEADGFADAGELYSLNFAVQPRRPF